MTTARGADPDLSGEGDPRRRAASGRPSASSRLMPIVITFAGVLVVVGTQAAQRGLITAVKIEWPAYLLGGVMIALGIAGLGRQKDEAPPEREEGPIRETGLDDAEADELRRLSETLRHIERARRAQLPDHDH